MAGSFGGFGLEDKLEKIRINYIKLVETAKADNIRSMDELEKKVMDEEENLKNKQERERREFEIKMLKEKYAMKERHLQEKNKADKKAAKRLKEAEDFIENVNPTSKKKTSQLDLRCVIGCGCPKIVPNLFSVFLWIYYQACKKAAAIVFR